MALAALALAEPMATPAAMPTAAPASATPAVDHLNLRVPAGCVYGLLGRNGAGKTTAIRVLLGLLPKDAGQVRWNGQAVTEAGTFFVQPRSAYTPQVPRLFSAPLRDNVLLGPPLAHTAREFESGPWGAGTLLYEVADPERFGVAELDAAGNVVGFEEKPAKPKSNLIPIGVYFLRPDAFGVVDQLVPSRRGELEITDLLNHYLPDNLFARRFEGLWTDAGTVTSLIRAAELAELESRAGRLSTPPARPTS